MKSTGIKLDDLFMNTDVSLCIIDRDFSILQLNTPLLAILGRSHHQVIRQKCYHIFHHDHCHTPACPIEQILGGLSHAHCRPLINDKDQMRHTYSLAASALYTFDNHLVGILANIKRPVVPEVAPRGQDSDRMRLSDTLAKTDFIANMSHELRTPLNGIVGLIEIIQETDLDAYQQNLFRTLLRESNSLLWIINSVLDLSKIQAGKLEFEHIPFDIRMTIEDVAQSMALSATQKGLEVNVHMPLAMPTLVMGDPTRLRQILVNLLGNAVKFTHEGEVRVNAKPIQVTPEYIKMQFEIIDTGVGIAEDKLESIFDSFTQTDSSTTREYGGSGLGTTIAKQLVEMMGGHIGITSRLGQGTTFWFILTFARQQGSPICSRTGQAILNGRRILLLDTDPRSRDLIAFNLNSWGCHVRVVENDNDIAGSIEETTSGLQAFSCFIASGFETAAPGFDLIERIRQYPFTQLLPVILMVKAGRVGDGKRCRELGIRSYLTKPIRMEDLRRSLELVIDGAAVKILPEQVLVTKHSLAEERRHCGRILLVEDYATNQQVVLSHLRSAGYEVDMAENGLAAVEAFCKNRYNLILMDIQMPEMDGFEATRRIRRIEKEDSSTHGLHEKDHKPGVPIVGMSAHALKGFQDRCADVGMDDYMTKPIKRNEFLQTVSRWITGSMDDKSNSSADDPCGSYCDLKGAHEGFDYRNALDEFLGDASKLIQVLQGFIGNVQRQIPKIGQAAANRNYEQLRKEAHAIKGGAANLTAAALSRLAAELEQLGIKHDLAGFDRLFPEFEAEFARLKRVVNHLSPGSME